MTAERPRTPIAQLVADHHAAVYRYAFRLSGSTADAEDLTQQVFLAAQQKLDQLNDPDKALNWLFAMLRNTFLKGRRQSQRWNQPGARLPLESIPAQSPGDEDIDHEQLQQALDSLGPEARSVLLMFYFEDLSYREIAAALQIPIGTVMSRLARAKQALRARLFENEPRRPVARSLAAGRL